MKAIILAVALVLICSVSYAKVYVPLDKETGEPCGMVDVNPKTVGEWAKRFIMIEADETYRGLEGYKIKYENQKLRKATQAEIDAYLAEKEAEDIVKKKQDALDTLGLKAKDIEKIKKLPDEVSP